MRDAGRCPSDAEERGSKVNAALSAANRIEPTMPGASPSAAIARRFLPECCQRSSPASRPRSVEREYCRRAKSSQRPSARCGARISSRMRPSVPAMKDPKARCQSGAGPPAVRLLEAVDARHDGCDPRDAQQERPSSDAASSIDRTRNYPPAMITSRGAGMRNRSGAAATRSVAGPSPGASTTVPGPAIRDEAVGDDGRAGAEYTEKPNARDCRVFPSDNPGSKTEGSAAKL